MKKLLYVLGILLAIVMLLFVVLFHWSFLFVAVSLILFSIFIKR